MMVVPIIAELEATATLTKNNFKISKLRMIKNYFWVALLKR